MAFLDFGFLQKVLMNEWTLFSNDALRNLKMMTQFQASKHTAWDTFSKPAGNAAFSSCIFVYLSF